MFNNQFTTAVESCYAINKEGVAFDYYKSISHDAYCRSDYVLFKNVLHTRVVREALSWRLIDKGNGRYDFSRYKNMMKIAKEEGMQIIWDLNHFDIPEQDPFSEKFEKRFAAYAREAVKVMRDYTDETLLVVPINEMSFDAYMNAHGEWYPFTDNRELEIKMQYVRANMAAQEAIWEIDTNVRFIQVDPFVYRACPADASPRLLQEAEYFNEDKVFQAWDMLYGKRFKALGGDEKYLDVIGVNYYPNCQEIYREDPITHEFRSTMLPLDSPLRQNASVFFEKVYKRYNRELYISETGGWGNIKIPWWNVITREVYETQQAGVPIVGVCAYPGIDRQDWHLGHWTNCAPFDCVGEDYARVPDNRLIQILEKNFPQGNFLGR